MKKDKIIVIGSVALLLTLAFYGGLSYGKSTAGPRVPASGQFLTGNFGGQNQNGTMRRNNQADGFTLGEIISKDDKSLTVKLRDGSSKLVFFSGSTEILKFATGTVSDILVGEQVTVSGSSNSDGSITAQSIQARPQIIK